MPPTRPSARPRVALTAVAAGVAVLAAACGSSATTTTKAAPAPAHAASAATTTVAVRTEAPYGTFLTTAKGFALYTYTADLPGGPGCTGECLHVWPPLLLAPGQLSVAATAGADFATSPRSDRLQATYQGLPLYTYIKDTAPGQVTGANVTDAGGTWKLANVGAPAPAAVPSTTAAPTTVAPAPASAPSSVPSTVAPSQPAVTTPAPVRTVPAAPRVTVPATTSPTTRPSAPATTVPPVGPSY